MDKPDMAQLTIEAKLDELANRFSYRYRNDLSTTLVGGLAPGIRL